MKVSFVIAALLGLISAKHKGHKFTYDRNDHTVHSHIHHRKVYPVSDTLDINLHGDDEKADPIEEKE